MNRFELTFVVAALLLIHDCATRARKLKFDETDVSNEVLLEEFEKLPGFSAFKRIDYIIESNAIPQFRVFVASDVKSEISRRLRNDGYDPYFLKDLQLLIPSKSLYGNRLIDAALDRGVIVGLSDFHSIDSTKASPKDFFQLLLVWNRLRVQYRVTVDRGGLKSVGEVGLDIGRLLMDVQMQKPSSKSPSIEMSKVTEVKTQLTGLDAQLDDFKTSVCAEAETKIKTVLNNEIRNILLKYVRNILSRDSEENSLSSYYSSL